MKKLLTVISVAALIGTPAFAADMAVKAPPPAPVAAPVYSWTGFYVGANGGYGWKDATVTFTPNDMNVQVTTCGGVFGGTCAPPTSFGIAGGFGGLEGGYNWQFNRQWLGVETDFDWSHYRWHRNFKFYPRSGLPAPSNFTASQNIRWLLAAHPEQQRVGRREAASNTRFGRTLASKQNIST